MGLEEGIVVEPGPGGRSNVGTCDGISIDFKQTHFHGLVHQPSAVDGPEQKCR